MSCKPNKGTKPGTLHTLRDRVSGKQETFEWTGNGWSTPGTGWGTKWSLMDALGWRYVSPVTDGVALGDKPSISDEELTRRFTRCDYPGPNPMYRCNGCGAEEFGVRNLLVDHAIACGVSVPDHQTVEPPDK